MPSSNVDLPVPLSPTMIVIARSKLSSKSSRSKGRQNGYASRSVMRDGSSQIRRRYGAGILMTRFRSELMRWISHERLSTSPAAMTEIKNKK